MLAFTLLLALAAPDTSRIVTLGGTATETVYALGLGDRVVGIDKSSLYPPEATKKPSVGYVRAFSAEGVLSLNPSLVIAVKTAGPAAALAQLRSAGVEVVLVSEERSVDGAKARVEEVAKAIGRVEAGARLVEQIDERIERAVAAAGRTKERPRVLFVYARGGGTLNVAGRDTAANAIIELARGVNVMSEFSGYRPMTAEATVRAAPDVILITEHGLASVGGKEALFALPGLAFTPAKANDRVVIMDDLLLLGFGPRVAEAVETLSSALGTAP